jgi:hypothetical protein
MERLAQTETGDPRSRIATTISFGNTFCQMIFPLASRENSVFFPLALRAKKRRPAADDDPPDRPPQRRQASPARP